MALSSEIILQQTFVDHAGQYDVQIDDELSIDVDGNPINLDVPATVALIGLISLIDRPLSYILHRREVSKKCDELSQYIPFDDKDEFSESQRDAIYRTGLDEISSAERIGQHFFRLGTGKFVRLILCSNVVNPEASLSGITYGFNRPLQRDTYMSHFVSSFNERFQDRTEKPIEPTAVMPAPPSASPAEAPLPSAKKPKRKHRATKPKLERKQPNPTIKMTFVGKGVLASGSGTGFDIKAITSGIELRDTIPELKELRLTKFFDEVLVRGGYLKRGEEEGTYVRTDKPAPRR